MSKWKSQGWVKGDGGVIKCKEVTSKTLERKEKWDNILMQCDISGI